MNITQYTQTPDNLFALLSKYRVIIPGIQRHYVQGADNPKAKEVRKSFITSLLKGEDKQLHFVYGPINYEDEDAFIPVDGQQRLTTLWLLARYVVERLDDQKQKEDIRKLLVRFSYEDRMHATRFCKALCSNTWDIKKNPQEDIPKQSWFLDYWKEDETVASMLRMLYTIHKEWENKGSDPNDVLDALVNKIKFSLRIDAFGDDIYMKMNARGLKLTQWENFKAKFADMLSKEIKEKWDKKIESFSNLYFEVADKQLPDKAFFALMGRVCYYLSFENGNKNDNLKNLASLASAELTKIPYVPFEEFTEALKNSNINDFAVQYLNLIDMILNKAKKENTYLNSPYWDKKSIIETFFNPTTDNERDFTLCCFEYVKAFPNAEHVAFSQAYRFMWNILENVWRSSDNPYNRVGYVKEQLDSNDPTLYPANEDWLHSKLAEANTPSQLIEEWQKALQMHAPNQDKPINWVGDWQNWQTAIEQAESYAFFNGAIRFLFQDANGNADWSQFDTKFENAQKYFDENGVKDCENTKYATDAIFVKAVLSRCTKNKFWKSVWWWGTIFNNRADTWKAILCDKEWCSAIHKILIGNLEIQHNNLDYLNKICNDVGLLKFIAKSDYKLSRIRNAPYGNYKALWVSRYPTSKIILNMITRELHRDGIITFYKGQIHNSHFVRGEDICFEYNNHYFIWYANNTICLMNDNCNGKYLRNKSGEETQENTYYFPNDEMPVDMSSADNIISAMDSLIHQSQKDAPQTEGHP